MMKNLLVIAVFLFGCGDVSSSAPESLSTPSALTLSCNANYQSGGAGSAYTKAALAISNQGADSLTQEVEHEGYSFQVVWHYSLTTLYMTIKKGGENVAFSTSRVPDNDHNDSMLDVGDKPRVWLSCDFVEYRPKP